MGLCIKLKLTGVMHQTHLLLNTYRSGERRVEIHQKATA